MIDVASAAAMMLPTPCHPRGRCVSMESTQDGNGNDVDVGALLRAAEAIEENDDNEPTIIPGIKNEEGGCDLSSLYRPQTKKTITTKSSSTAAAAAANATTALGHMSIGPKRSSDTMDDMGPPPKKISRKKHHRRISSSFSNNVDVVRPSSLCVAQEDYDEDDVSIQPTVLFAHSPLNAPKKVSRTKRRVLCSTIGCSNHSFHSNVGACSFHGGNHIINPINLFFQNTPACGSSSSSSNNSSSNGYTQEHPATAAPAVRLFCAAVAGDNA